MNLLVYSYFSVFSKYLSGGAQLVMRDLLVDFANNGLEVTVVCPHTSMHKHLLQANNNLKILPVLFNNRQQKIDLGEHLSNLQAIYRATKNADLIWSLDRAFPIETSKPIVLTLQTISYEKEIRSIFSRWDMLVVPSDYLYSIAKNIVGPENWDGFAPQILRITNGIDLSHFKPDNKMAMCARVGLEHDDIPILFPHRLDMNKGFITALKVIAKLKVLDDRFKLLIPVDTRPGPSNKKVAERLGYLKSLTTDMGIGSHVLFHQWIDLDVLPSYFSIGICSLNTSRLPEGFGFTNIQSVSCGTPVISTRSGALGELLPEGHGVIYVGNDAIDDIVASVVNPPSKSELTKGRDYITTHYSIKRTASIYLRAFEKVRKKRGKYFPASDPFTFRMSPWCRFIDATTIWHDLRMRRYRINRDEAELLNSLIEISGIDRRQDVRHVSRLLKLGIIIHG